MKKTTKLILGALFISAVSVVVTATCNGNLDMHGFKITNLGAPEDANDATTKTYVDQLIIASASGGYPTQISDLQGPKNLKDAANTCSEMGGGWRIPTPNELINLCASARGNCTSGNYLWTTGYRYADDYYRRIRESDYYPSYSTPGTAQYFRCVR
jgi:hypothetical protein